MPPAGHTQETMHDTTIQTPGGEADDRLTRSAPKLSADTSLVTSSGGANADVRRLSQKEATAATTKAGRARARCSGSASSGLMLSSLTDVVVAD